MDENNGMPSTSSKPIADERQMVEALRSQVPVRGLQGVSIAKVQPRPKPPFDISFELHFGRNRIRVLGEVKQTLSPRIIADEIAPWITRLKYLRPDLSLALVAPALSEQAQQFCIEKRIDFLDLVGNISISIPGKFILRRTGMRTRPQEGRRTESPPTSNIFSGRYSRVLRVLLENPKQWTLTEIARELNAESKRFGSLFPSSAGSDFVISLGAISKALAGLEEQLCVRRRGTAVIMPEPRRVLTQWAEKYRERYRWRLRSSFQTDNPFGPNLAGINRGLEELVNGTYAFTAVAATSTEAPFFDVEVVDIFLTSMKGEISLRKLGPTKEATPSLRFISPYDIGVFMYSKKVRQRRVVSDTQAYLDLYARGGRDLKQAEFLLSNSIVPRWSTL